MVSRSALSPYCLRLASTIVGLRCRTSHGRKVSIDQQHLQSLLISRPVFLLRGKSEPYGSTERIVNGSHAIHAMLSSTTTPLPRNEGSMSLIIKPILIGF